MMVRIQMSLHDRERRHLFTRLRLFDLTRSVLHLERLVRSVFFKKKRRDFDGPHAFHVHQHPYAVRPGSFPAFTIQKDQIPQSVEVLEIICPGLSRDRLCQFWKMIRNDLP